MTACDGCLRRTALLGWLASHLQRVSPRHDELTALLTLDDEALLAALAGARGPSLIARYEGFDSRVARERARAAELTAVCRHDPAYPEALRGAPGAPAVLHLTGRLDRLARGLAESPAVAIVGSRRASPYGLEVARALGRDLAAAGVPVVSGMALGIDSAAHAGTLDAGGFTVAVLAGGADTPYPASKRALYRRIAADGCVVSEMPPGFQAFRWCFPARNRIIAGLSALTVVVEAARRSGSLITAAQARTMGRDVAAVPGQVTVSVAAGPNGLIYDGAAMVRDVQDVLDVVFGAGMRRVRSERAAPRLEGRLARVLDAVGGGRDVVAELAASPADVDGITTALAELELLGLVRRDLAGHYTAVMSA